MVNNLIYNPGSMAIHFKLVRSEWLDNPYATGRISIAGNACYFGPDTQEGMPLFSQSGSGRIINSEQDAGGYPQMATAYVAFNPDEWDLYYMIRK